LLVLGLTALAYIAPNTLNLRTARELVAAARHEDPDLQVTYWGHRSYSAEFYTQGKVRFTDRTATFEALADNGARDAVAIRATDAEALAPLLGQRFDRIGQFGRHVLFVERSSQGDAL